MHVPLALLREVASVAVLFGDHFQLGPLVISPLASEIGGLETSMLERLANERLDIVRKSEEESGLTRDALVACEQHRLFFLTESYRSHPAIMSLYSRIFYADQLQHQAHARQKGVLPFFQAYGLDIPVILHNVVGVERRDSD